MRLKISHRTRLHYDPAVHHAIFVLRQTPCTCTTQFVRNWRVEVSLDTWFDRSVDAFGNALTGFSLKGPLDAVTIVAAGEVEVDDTSGVVGEGGDRLPVAFFLRETGLTEVTEAIRAFAAGISGEDPLARAHGLSAAITKTLKPTTGWATHGSAAEALALETGNAVEAAHLFCAGARQMGIPARIVSGYLCDEAGSGLHFWAEAHMATLGWVGFDPVFERCPTDAYVRLAVGTDFPGVDPMRESCDPDVTRAVEMEVTVTCPAGPQGNGGNGSSMRQSQGGAGGQDQQQE